jgi:hypothetical protein
MAQQWRVREPGRGKPFAALGDSSEPAKRMETNYLGRGTCSAVSDFVFWFLRDEWETKNKVSCIGLVHNAPVHPSLKAVSLSTAGPEKVSSDGPLGD